MTTSAASAIRRHYPKVGREWLVGSLSGRWVGTPDNREKNQSGSIESNLMGVITCPPPWVRAVALKQPNATNPDVVDVGWVKEELRDAIARCHRIAHDADINPGAATPGTAEPIRRETVETWLWVIESVGLATMDVIEERLA